MPVRAFRDNDDDDDDDVRKCAFKSLEARRKIARLKYFVLKSSKNKSSLDNSLYVLQTPQCSAGLNSSKDVKQHVSKMNTKGCGPTAVTIMLVLTILRLMFALQMSRLCGSNATRSNREMNDPFIFDILGQNVISISANATRNEKTISTGFDIFKDMPQSELGF